MRPGIRKQSQRNISMKILPFVTVFGFPDVPQFEQINSDIVFLLVANVRAEAPRLVGSPLERGVRPQSPPLRSLDKLKKVGGRDRRCYADHKGKHSLKPDAIVAE